MLDRLGRPNRGLMRLFFRACNRTESSRPRKSEHRLLSTTSVRRESEGQRGTNMRTLELEPVGLQPLRMPAVYDGPRKELLCESSLTRGASKIRKCVACRQLNVARRGGKAPDCDTNEIVISVPARLESLRQQASSLRATLYPSIATQGQVVYKQVPNAPEVQLRSFCIV